MAELRETPARPQAPRLTPEQRVARAIEIADDPKSRANAEIEARIVAALLGKEPWPE
jgi:hypothetical protein